MTTPARFDAVAVNIKTKKVRIFARDAKYENAAAVCGMAVMRRGVDEEFYSVTPTMMYEEGDTWNNDGGAANPEPPEASTRIRVIGGMGFPIGPRGLDR